MRYPTLAVLAALAPAVHAQLDTTTITMDVLHAPVSPASVLLGVAESEIQRPSGLTDFMVSLRQGTNDFSQLPKNYAIDIAPAWLFGKHISASDMMGIDAAGNRKDEHLGNTIWQSLVISAAVKDPDAVDGMVVNPSAGFGFKFSLCRGHITGASRSSLLKVRTALSNYTNLLHGASQRAINEDPEHMKIRAALDSIDEALEHTDSLLDVPGVPENERALLESLRKTQLALKIGYSRQLSARAAADSESANADEFSMVKTAAETFKMEREGFFWDFAGGVVLDFMDRRLDNSAITSAGVWTTLSWDSTGNFPFQLMGRYLYNPGEVFMSAADSLERQDVHNIDGGARITYAPQQGRFNFSAEALYRTVLNVDGIDPTWRLVANAQYAVSTNNLLTFSFGKNFDGTLTKDGNLIAALNLLIGLGDKRKL